MARMHSGRRGKHGSKKPAKKAVPSWVAYKPKDIELLIAKLAKDGKKPSAIGLILRDTYGIPHVKTMCDSSITKIMQQKNVAPELPEDLLALMKKLANLLKHIEKNRVDEKAKRGITLTESKINRLVKYYKRTGKLDNKWKMDLTRIGYFA